jgi:hypothetical protein
MEELPTALLERLDTAIKKAGFSHELEHGEFRLSQVGYANRSVNMTIGLISTHGEQLVEFQSLVGARTSFEYAALAVFEGNFRCRVVGFSAEEVSNESGKSFQLVARTHLYANHFSDQELQAMLKIFLSELDEIDDELELICIGGVSGDE